MNDTPSFRDYKPRPRQPRDNQNGHTIILKTAINKKQKLIFELVNGSARGYVTQFDNYTITIAEEIGFETVDLSIQVYSPPKSRQRTIFKHAIISFYPAEV